MSVTFSLSKEWCEAKTNLIKKMPKRFYTVIGDSNDAVLLQHLASANRDLPIQTFEDQIDWGFLDKKTKKPITREQIQSRFSYLRQLYQEDLDSFNEICISKLSPQVWKNLDIQSNGDDSDWEEEDEKTQKKKTPKKSNKKRGATIDENSN